MVLEDAPLIVRWRNLPHVASMSDESHTAHLTVQKHCEWFLNTRDKRYDYVIIEKEREQPIGSVSLVRRGLVQWKEVAESGRYIGETSALRKGFAMEAAQCWIEFAFEKLGFDCVFAKTRKTNLPNIKINHKLGFVSRPWPDKLPDPGEEWLFMLLTKQKWECSQ